MSEDNRSLTTFNQDPANDFGNLEEMKGGIITIPTCKVGQPTNKTKLEVGKFNWKGVNFPPSEKIESAVVLRPQLTRVLFGRNFTDPAFCKSDDHRNPSTYIERPVSPSCVGCFASKWDNECSEEDMTKKLNLETTLNKKRNTAPLCSETINLIVMDRRGIPFSLTFNKTQLGNVKKSLLNPLKFSGRRLFILEFDITLENVDGSYFEYKFSDLREVPKELQAGNFDKWQWFNKHGQEALAHTHQAMDEAKDEEIPF